MRRPDQLASSSGWLVNEMVQAFISCDSILETSPTALLAPTFLRRFDAIFPPTRTLLLEQKIYQRSLIPPKMGAVRIFPSEIPLQSQLTGSVHTTV